MFRTIFNLMLVSLPIAAHAEWKNESQAGIVITGGNSRTQSLNLKSESQYSFTKNTFRFDANYLQAKQSGVKSAESWMLGLRYERAFRETLSGFLAQSVEGDRFAGILQRYNTDVGAKQYLYKRPKDFEWFLEGGYRFTSEHSSDGIKQNFQKGRLYTEAEKFWASATSTKLWLEYIPNFTRSQAWLFNGEVSASSALNSIFSVKTAYLVKYNNEPPVASAMKTDTAFTTSLVAKF